MEHGSSENYIVLLDTQNLTIQRRIWLDTDPVYDDHKGDGVAHRVAVLGDDFVTVWKNKMDNDKIWINVHSKDGTKLRSWRCGSSHNDEHYVTTHKGHIYVTDGWGKLFVYSGNGDLVKELRVNMYGRYTCGIVCLDEEILVAMSGDFETARLLSINHKDYSMEDVFNWGNQESQSDDEFGAMSPLAIYQDYVAIGGSERICVYKVHIP